MKTRPATPEHGAFLDDLKGALAKHTHLPPVEMLAIASQFVGALLALQDQTKYTPAQLLELVGRNLERGNEEAIRTVFSGPGGTA